MFFATWWRRWCHWRSLGARGERWAAAYYAQQGGQLLAQNWRAGVDELDLVVLEGRVVVFIEVKTRTAEQGGEGYGAVNRRKKRALRRAVRAWLREIDRIAHVRCDIVEVLVCNSRLVRILQHRGVLLLRRRHS
jgi:putative endonuclease